MVVAFKVYQVINRRPVAVFGYTFHGCFANDSRIQKELLCSLNVRVLQNKEHGGAAICSDSMCRQMGEGSPMY
jgi:hypothetical protein